MDGSGQSEAITLRVEGRGCVFGRQMVFGYPPETETQVQFRVSIISGELQFQFRKGQRKKADSDDIEPDCFNICITSR